MRWGLVVIASLGCGRVAFDPLSDSGGGLDGPLVIGTQDGSRGTWLLPMNPGTSTPCTFDTVFHDSCEHAAEHLMARVADATTDCDTLELGDDLHAFDWACSRVGGDLVFQSQGLAASAGLSTLVDASGWKLDRFYARAAGVEVMASAPAVWWDNPVVPLPDNSTTGTEVTLDQPRTIYVLASSRATSGYVIGADYIGIVILPGAVLTAGTIAADCGERNTTGAKCFIQSTQPHTGTWIEGELSGDGFSSLEMGVVLDAPQWATLRHLRVHGLLDGAYAYMGTGILVFDFVGTRNGAAFTGDTSSVTARHVLVAGNSTGYYATNAGYHVLVDARGYSDNDSIKFINNAAPLIADVFTARENGSGVILTEAINGGSLHAISSFSNQSVGVSVGRLIGGSVNRILSVNNSGDGLRLDTVLSSVISQVVGVHDVLYGIELAGCTNDLFVGNLLFGNNAAGDCFSQGGSNSGLDNACGRPATQGNTVTGLTLLSSFTGGTATANETTIADLSLPGHEQAWGADGTGPLDPSARGRCSAGATCHQWDYSLLQADLVLRDAGATGTPSDASKYVPGAACPAAASVAITNPAETCFPGYPAPCPRTYLANAIEILDDHHGNDDGFCESNERCIYLPHMTSYPERGTLLPPCTFADGAVTGVTLYGYAD